MLQVKSVGLVQLEELVSLCTNAGIASTTLDAMFRLGDFQGDMVDPKEPLVLLLTMTDSTFMGVVSAIFEVFGEEVGHFYWRHCRDNGLVRESMNVDRAPSFASQFVCASVARHAHVFVRKEGSKE